MEQSATQSDAAARQADDVASQRSFLVRTGFAIGAVTVGTGRVGKGIAAFADSTGEDYGRLTRGDVAILRFLAAAELIESDLWQQYNELGGTQDNELPKGHVIASYARGLQQLDGDMDQYIHDNTEDEISHAAFLNAYLAAQGAEPVDRYRFCTLPSSMAPGTPQTGRHFC